MSNTTKRYIISTGVTFISAFLLFVMPILTDPNWAYTGEATLAALLLAGVRAGVKAVWEFWLPKLQSR